MHASEPSNEVPDAEALIVYEPTPPAPVPNETTVVPAVTPVPVSTMPTTIAPDATADTERVVPVTDPVKLGIVAPASALEPTICDTLTVHTHGNVLADEQAPATITVFDATPVPESVAPTPKKPVVRTESVSVVPTIEPVAEDAAKAGAVPSPAGQKKPGGHAVCVKPPAKLVQKKPALHALAVSDALPAARQKPVLWHGVHADAPPLLKVPTGHAVGCETPAAQNDPAGQDVPTVIPGVGQKVPAAQGFAVAVALPVAVQKPAAHAAAVELVEPAGQKKPTLQFDGQADADDTWPETVPHVPAAQGEHDDAPPTAEKEPAGQLAHAVPLRKLPALHTAVPESVTPPAPSVHDVPVAVLPSAKQSNAAPLIAAGEGGVKEYVASVDDVSVTVVAAAVHPYCGVAT